MAPESESRKTFIGEPARHREYAAAREFIRQKYPNGLDAIALAEFSLERNEHLQKMVEQAQQIVTANTNMTVAPPTIVPSPPAPLTCSEVVERLMQEAVVRNGANSWLDRAAAEKILDGWRERRVQELEEALRGLLAGGNCLPYDEAEMCCEWCDSPAQYPHKTGCAWIEADRVLTNSEWREQIRKGAKHESD